MKLYTIKQGRHRAWPWRFGLYLSKKKIRFRVVFDVSCRYDIGKDQTDINKLFGVGYLPTHHKESARFGWVYNPQIGRVELYAYCYVQGKRITDLITSVPFHHSYVLQLEVKADRYEFTVFKDGFQYTSVIQHSHHKKISYPLGLYFGGNRTAPHKITIEMKKA